MTNKRRNMILEIADGVAPVLHIMNIVDGHRRCDEVLAYLIKNKIRGHQVIDIVRYEFSMSRLAFLKDMLRRIDHEKETKPIYAGDYWN